LHKFAPTVPVRVMPAPRDAPANTILPTTYMRLLSHPQ
jgi:hypothetical protein